MSKVDEREAKMIAIQAVEDAFSTIGLSYMPYSQLTIGEIPKDYLPVETSWTNQIVRDAARLEAKVDALLEHLDLEYKTEAHFIKEKGA